MQIYTLVYCKSTSLAKTGMPILSCPADTSSPHPRHARFRLRMLPQMEYLFPGRVFSCRLKSKTAAPDSKIWHGRLFAFPSLVRRLCGRSSSSSIVGLLARALGGRLPLRWFRLPSQGFSLSGRLTPRRNSSCTYSNG